MIRQKRRLWIWVVGLAAMVSLPVLAQEESRFENALELSLLDSTQDQLSRSALWLARNVNSWFGDQPFDEGGRVSGSVSPGISWREDDGSNASLRFSLSARLPNVDLFFGRETEDDFITDRPDSLREQQSARGVAEDSQRRFFGGIGKALNDQVSFRIGVRSGLNVYAQARYETAWEPTESTYISFAETFFVDADRGLGATTTVNLGYLATDRIALRSRNSTTVSRKKDGWDWITASGPIKNLGRDRDLWLDALAFGNTREKVTLREYALIAGYRQPVYKDWVIGEVQVGHYWPQKDEDPSRQTAWGLNANLQMRF
ncbi:hypothetical protein SAMN05216526_1581 [Ectothiorhodosinus mongolicus]|uniref:Uncharacterized protein n=2 Tax=Ectothiorhodosinus mongolicus TaxID=233100 RepID=A0A1R3W4Z1_9GAMM|nr:hypothetical protein [Ectothiorhodosinus mongolicus]ULX57430.1 hypothetical protein CKX93_06920 [Ectothiorhodosinus mongolicus]SIT72141.1 hypothetical protein SAMN05216526_1581 [Ectothiorhodosinus mongolicus]